MTVKIAILFRTKGNFFVDNKTSHRKERETMLYNMAQGPISEKLWDYLLSQVSETPSQELLDRARVTFEEEKIGHLFEQLRFTRSCQVEDLRGSRPRFYVVCKMNLDDEQKRSDDQREVYNRLKYHGLQSTLEEADPQG